MRSRTIRVTNQYAIVDAPDYSYLKNFTWSLRNGYVTRADYKVKPYKCYIMSREILRIDDPNTVVYYRDGNRLNNRRSNLGVTTKHEHHQKIGQLGGKKSRGGGFSNRELAREAGRRGGLASRKRRSV